MIFRNNMLSVMLVMITSCSNDMKVAETETTRKTFNQRLNEKNGYVQDSEGNWKIQGDKRSSFESHGASPYFKGDYQKKTYKTGEYSKKSWWGNKDYDRKTYDGKTDGSRFMTQSDLDGKSARETSKTAKIPGPYATKDFATNQAVEADAEQISKPSDAETDTRRRVFQTPKIIDWHEQRTMSLEQSKGLLGR